MRVIDLFAGCGGMSLGFENAGFDIIAAFDNWDAAIKIYESNFALSHKTDAFREEIAMAIKLFADIYLGHRAFNYEECNQATKSLMELLAQDFPDVYSGITDPLSAMHDIVIKQSHENTVDAEDTSVDNEATFKDWLARLPKANGDLYSENTRNQYISALKSVANQFADTIGPFTSVFEIADVETFKKVASAIKGHATYHEQC